ncbi:hypothetical protein CRYUN_Cryun41cG0029200 [Craigia yunnanensis]
MNRNLAERERRSNMRNLFSRLFSLLPPQTTRILIPDMVELATVYINHCQRRLEELRQRKMQLEEANKEEITSEPMISPVLNIIDSNSTMEVNLITGSEMKLALSDIISTIKEEGAEVLSVTYNNTRNMNILSIHCRRKTLLGFKITCIHVVNP